MSTTTDFKEWIKGVELEDHNEIYALYKAVMDCKPFGIYDVKPAKGLEGGWIVSAPHTDLNLLLASDAAKEAFLLHIHGMSGARELDVESWHNLMLSQQKDD